MKIALGGVAGSGKDTLVSSLSGFCVLSFGDYLKEIAHYIFDWFPEDFPSELKEKELEFETSLGDIIKIKPRNLWIKLNCLREIENKLFIRKLDNDLKFYEKYFDDIIITDIRTKDEFNYCKEKGFFTIYIEPTKKVFEKVNDYDKQLFDLKKEFDLTFVNKFNGTQEFKKLIEKIKNENF